MSGAGWAAAARERKVAHIAEFLWDGMEDDVRRWKGMPDHVAGLPRATRNAVAAAASTDAVRHGPPSEETWAMVVASLRRRQERLVERDDPFARHERASAARRLR